MMLHPVQNPARMLQEEVSMVGNPNIRIDKWIITCLQAIDPSHSWSDTWKPEPVNLEIVLDFCWKERQNWMESCNFFVQWHMSTLSKQVMVNYIISLPFLLNHLSKSPAFKAQYLALSESRLALETLSPLAQLVFWLPRYGNTTCPPIYPIWQKLSLTWDMTGQVILLKCNKCCPRVCRVDGNHGSLLGNHGLQWGNLGCPLILQRKF